MDHKGEPSAVIRSGRCLSFGVQRQRVNKEREKGENREENGEDDSRYYFQLHGNNLPASLGENDTPEVSATVSFCLFLSLSLSLVCSVKTPLQASEPSDSNFQNDIFFLPRFIYYRQSLRKTYCGKEMTILYRSATNNDQREKKSIVFKTYSTIPQQRQPCKRVVRT